MTDFGDQHSTVELCTYFNYFAQVVGFKPTMRSLDTKSFGDSHLRSLGHTYILFCWDKRIRTDDFNHVKIAL